MGFSVGGKRIFESSLAGAAQGSYPLNFVWNDQGGAAANLSDLTVIAKSTDYIGASQFAKQGVTCATGSSYNACTNKCETKIITSCQ